MGLDITSLEADTQQKIKMELLRKALHKENMKTAFLNVVRNKGVLVLKREGEKIFYSLKNTSFTEIVECINRCNEE